MESPDKCQDRGRLESGGTAPAACLGVQNVPRNLRSLAWQNAGQ
jgi:hypothetical protein